MGDFNCRHEAWNDTTRNQNGQLLHEYIESAEHLTIANPNTPTFSCINSSSIINLCITSPNLLPSLSNIMVITRHSKPYWNECLSSLSENLRQVKKKLKQRENDSHWAQYMRHKELFKLELNHSLNTRLQDNCQTSGRNINVSLWTETK